MQLPYNSHTYTDLSGGDESGQYLESILELVSLGISEPCHSVHQEFEDNVLFKDSWYEVCLPWRKSHPILPDSYELSW